MAKYQYGLTPTEFVKENPEEYIIPECLEACKILWDKGIETVQCSNYENTSLWIEIEPLSLASYNSHFVYDMINSKMAGFDVGYLTHNPRIYADGMTEASVERLNKLANMFQFQDTKHYVSAEEYLDNYRRKDGKYEVLPSGVVQRGYNPHYMNATLEEALEANGHTDLYVPEEERVYGTPEALEHHQRFLERIHKKSTK